MSSPTPFYPNTHVVTLTREQLNAFHSMDRALYSRLVQIIGRDRTESMHVMALWLWLERQNKHGRNLIPRLLSFSNAFISMLAQETVVCLRCIQSDFIPVREFHNVNDVPILHSVLGGQINLLYFRENRVSILEGVNSMMNQVCFRVFDDIGVGSGAVSPSNTLPRGGNFRGFGGMVGQDRELVQVEPDERTIFLTFSKGYPTSEVEVRDFFTRRFGDIIEDFRMQDVPRERQALYAKLIVHTPEIINMVLEGQPRMKFIINGKHVCARKFVRKQR